MKTVAVIMAGGRGERFWPLSRRERPKQFLNLYGEENLLQKTYKRIKDLNLVDDIYVVSGVEMKDLVKQSLPELSEKSLLLEPTGRNTAPCVAYASYRVRTVYGEDTIILTFPSDHHIEPQNKFKSSVEKAIETAKDGKYLVTFGIKPEHPETGYGYIKISEPFNKKSSIFRVDEFVEKPDKKTAQQYLNSGDYYWNSGMFIWRTDRIISAIEEYLPELSEKFSPIIPHLSTVDERDAIERYFPELPSISIDYGVMERDKDIALVEAEFKWSDLGCWDALDKIFKQDSSQNIVEGKSIEINSRNNIIVSEGIPIVCYGIEDMIVVSTEDAVLLIPRGKSQNVREIIDKLKEGEDWEKGIL